MPIPPSSLHYTVGPVIAAVVLLIIIGFTRWAFSQQTRYDPFGPSTGVRASAQQAESTGLLQTVARLPRREEAAAFRAVLSDAGIRSTIREPNRGGADVLVFPADADRARRLAGPFATPT